MGEWCEASERNYSSVYPVGIALDDAQANFRLTCQWLQVATHGTNHTEPRMLTITWWWRRCDCLLLDDTRISTPSLQGLLVSMHEVSHHDHASEHKPLYVSYHTASHGSVFIGHRVNDLTKELLVARNTGILSLAGVHINRS